MGLTIVFSVAGGLGLFLYGMKLMSEGLEKVAGARMRGILEFFTKNRFSGMLVGIAFTAIVQSSSATTVMVVSFVNSGLMSLLQASGVILGANIGTTVTGQLIAFNLSDIAPLFVMVGVVMVMFCKKQRVKKLGEVVLGFGVLFMGLSIMSAGMQAIKESPQLVEYLKSLNNYFAALLTGFIITAILQSSSATVGIIILMASQGLLTLSICPFLVMGCNIGSCVSALIASLGGKKDAKRAALIHFLFNVFGTFVAFIIMVMAVDPIMSFIYRFSHENAARSVANLHTAIKIFEVILLFPWMKWIVKATYRIVPGGETSGESNHELLYIGEGDIMTPSTAFLNSVREIEHMAQVSVKNLTVSMKTLCKPDEDLIREVYAREEYIDFLNRKITDYLVKVNELDLPLADAELMGALFHVVNDIERIGDHAENFADAAKSRIEHEVVLSDKALAQINGMMEKVLLLLNYAIDMFAHNTSEYMNEVLRLEDEIDEEEKRLQWSHIKRLTQNKCTPEGGMIFSDTISGLERVADHATNIAFAIKEKDIEKLKNAEE